MHDTDRGGVSLKTFLGLLIGLSLLPLLLLSLWLAYDRVHDHKVQLERDGERLARNVTAVIDQYLEIRIRALNMLAVSPLIDDPARWPELYIQAQNFRTSFDSHVILASVDEPRQMLFNTRMPFGEPLPPLPQPRGHAAATTAVATLKPAVGDSFMGPIALEPLVAIVVPVVRNETAVFLLVTIFETRHFQALLDALRLPDGWAVSLQDSRGDLIARLAPPDIAIDTVPLSGYFEVRSTLSLWSVILKIPRPLHEAQLFATVTALGVGLLGATLAGLFIGALASRRLSHAVAKLLNGNAGEGAWPDIVEIAFVRQRLKCAAEAAQESAARFQAIFEQAAVGIAQIAPNGQWLRVNRQLCVMLGYEAAELLSKTFQDITHPADLKMDLESVRRVLGGEVAQYALEKRYICKDGRHIWCHLTVSLVRAADGQPDYFISVIKDISDRKQAEQALRESEARLRILIDHAPAALAMFDQEMRYLAVSQRWLDDYDLNSEKILGLSHYAIFPEIPERWKLIHQRCLGGQVMRAEEDVLVRTDGYTHWLCWEIRPWYTTDGSVGGIVIFSEDITARKQAENALRDSQGLLQTLFNSIPDLVWMKDPQGRIMHCNPRFEALFGIAQAQIIGKTDYEFLPCEEADTCLLSHQLALVLPPQAIHRSIEALTFASDGHQELVQVIKTPVYDTHGTLLGVLGIGRDITEIKRVEKELEHHRQHLEELVMERTAELTAARTEAERLAHAKSEFLANMSHEIRTPMNAVLGLAYLLERQALPPEAHELTRKIHQAGCSLLGIINDILDFSKMEAGHIEIERAPFQLDTVLDHLATIMATTVGDKALELIIRPPNCLQCTLFGDSLRLGQILTNLTSNAIKFTEHGVVEVGVDLLALTKTRARMRFAVRDTGIGIDEATQARLFQPFVQADASTTRRFGGSGLGLVISRRLVELMGGRLQLDSRPGDGSRFWFELSFDVAEYTPKDTTAAQVRVLIVEDDACVSEALTATSTALAWLSTEVRSEAQALKLILRDPLWQGIEALVLVDHHPPVLDGLSIAHEISQILADHARPLLFLLTKPQREQMLKTSDSRIIDRMLSKPLTPNALYDAVNQARSQRLGNPLSPTVQTIRKRRLAGVRLLVVDDCEINREVAQRIFCDEGAVVYLANEGQQAIHWLMAHPDTVDMVLMDVQMPVMDGRTATRLIRAHTEILPLPIIALTADTVGDQQRAALDAGMDAFLSKPFEVSEAIALILSLSKPVAARQEVTPSHTATTEAAPQSTAPVPPAEGAALPGIAIDQGLAIWRDVERYRQYLRRFAHTYADSARRIAELEPEAAQQLAHKLKGAAGNVGLPEVAAQAGLVEKQLLAGQEIAIAGLHEALNIALASIAQYASDTATKEAVSPEPQAVKFSDAAHAQVTLLLRQMFKAFEQFDPPAARPALDALSAFVSHAHLNPVRQAVDEFDAPAGLVCVRTLAKTLSICVED